MADTSDVETALVTLIAEILYPDGVSWGAAVSPVAGSLCDIRRGWPVPAALDAAMAAQQVLITIFQQPGMSRLEVGDLRRERGVPGAAPTLTASAAGGAVIFGGTAAAGQLAGVAADGAPYAYAVLGTDTPLSVAQALAALMGGGLITDDSDGTLTDDSGDALFTAVYASAVAVSGLSGPQIAAIDAAGGTAALAAAGSGGAVLLVPTTRPLLARVMPPGQSERRPRQQTQGFCITCWAPTAALRDVTCSQLDAVLSDTRWLQLPDQAGRLLWHGTRSDDISTTMLLYRRDLTFQVTFWTTRIFAAPAMLWGTPTNNGASAGIG